MNNQIASNWNITKYTFWYFLISGIFIFAAGLIIATIIPPFMGAIFYFESKGVLARIASAIGFTIVFAPILYRTFRIVNNFKFKGFRVQITGSAWFVWLTWFAYTFALQVPLYVIDAFYKGSIVFEVGEFFASFIIDVFVLKYMLLGKLHNPGIAFVGSPQENSLGSI